MISIRDSIGTQQTLLLMEKRVLQEIEATPPGVLSSRGIKPSANGEITRIFPFFPESKVFRAFRSYYGVNFHHLSEGFLR